MQHWICPLFKRGSVADPENYRGVHLTSQISKVVERVLAHTLIAPYVRSLNLYGSNQFAYTRGRGARDVIAFLVMTWLFAFASNKKVAVYCSDVSGAFDRANKDRLIVKLRNAGIH